MPRRRSLVFWSAPTRNVNLTDHFDRFIETGITSGRGKLFLQVVKRSVTYRHYLLHTSTLQHGELSAFLEKFSF